MADSSSVRPSSHTKKLGITQRATPLAAPWRGDFRVRYESESIHEDTKVNVLASIPTLNRFSDFQVNEIGEDGKVIHLRSIGSSESKVEVR